MIMARAALTNLGDGLAARVAPGHRDAVLWIHGYSLDSASWIPLWNLLPDWCHIGIDLPGHGASLPLQSADTLPAVARRIARVAVAHNVRHCIALSFGTLIATQLAIEFPDALRSLVLGAPALGGGPQDPAVAARYDELMALYRRDGFHPQLRARWMTSPPDIFKGAERQPELWASLWRLVGRHGWWELADGSFSRLANHAQTTQHLQRIQAATLLLVGEQELPAFKRCAELIRRAVPSTTRAYLANVGHLCMLEDPQRTAPLIDGHLRAHSISPAPEEPDHARAS